MSNKKLRRWIRKRNLATNLYEYTGRLHLRMETKQSRAIHTWFWEMELFYEEKLWERYGLCL